MKKRIISLVLALLMIVTLVPPFSASAEMSASEVVQQIKNTYSTAKSKYGKSFDQSCGAYVAWQLNILGITSSYTGFNGNAAYDTFKNSTKSSGGYDIYKYPSSSYSLKSALNAISSNGTKNAYNILVGFETGYGDNGKKWGHTCFIHAIIGGKVYFSESFGCTIGGTYYSEGSPITCSIDTFCSYYNSWTTLDGLIHFSKSSCTVTFNANGGSCSTSTKTVTKGGSISSLPTATRTNYTFDGWYTASSGGTKITTSTTFSSNTTVYAHWTVNTAKVTLYNADGSTWQSASANYGSSYTLPATYPSKADSYFCGWAYKADAEDYDIRPDEKITISGNVNLYPVFVSYDEVVSGEPVFIYNVDDFDDDAYTATEKTVSTTVEKDASYWSNWSSYSTTEVTASATRQVRTETLYRYYYYLCPYCGAHEPFYGESDCKQQIPSSAWHATWSTVPYSKCNYKSFSYTTLKYYTTSLGDGQMWIFSAGNVNDTAVGTIDTCSNGLVICKGYSYRDYISKTETTTVSKTGYVFELTGCKHDYSAESIAATDADPAHILYTCKECGESYKEYVGEWSDWSSSLPNGVTADKYDIEEMPMYRYRDNTTSTVYGDWGSTTTTSSKPTESDTLRITKTQTYYNYYHYCCNYYNGKNNVDSKIYGDSGAHYYHTLKLTYQLSATDVPDKGEKTLYGYYDCSAGFRVWAQADPFKTYEYTYQTRTANKVTTNGDWSAWQSSKPDSKTNRDIETTTYYRYKLKTYDISYDANGGINAPANTVKAYGADFKLSSLVPTRDGFNFLGWSTVKDGAVAYMPGAVYTANSALSLFAKWEAIHVHSWDNGVVSKEASCTEDGVKIFSCSGCDETKTAIIPALGHNYENGKCTRCGKADPSAPVKVVTGDVTAYAGETVTVPVIISDNTGFAGFDFTLNFDSDVLTLTEVTKGEVLNTSDSGILDVDTDNGTVSYKDSVNIESEGTLLYLTFKVADDAAAEKCTVSLKLKDGKAGSFAAEDGKAVYVNLSAGSVTIEKTVSFEEAGLITVSSEKARAGEEVTVSVSMEENPGIMVMVLGIDYDRNKLSLVGYEDGGLKGWTVGNNAVWIGDSDSTYNGVILKLKFKVLEDCEDGDVQINMLYSVGDIANYNEEVICPGVVPGKITVVSNVPGDFTGDGVVNALDLLRIKKYLAGDNVELAGSGDVTGDGVVNALDLLRIKKYLAGDSVELK